MRDGDFIFLLFSTDPQAPPAFRGVVASEEEAEKWRQAPPSRESRWWEMWEVGQPDQGRLDSSPVARG